MSLYVAPFRGTYWWLCATLCEPFILLGAMAFTISTIRDVQCPPHTGGTLRFGETSTSIQFYPYSIRIMEFINDKEGVSGVRNFFGSFGALTGFPANYDFRPFFSNKTKKEIKHEKSISYASSGQTA